VGWHIDAVTIPEIGLSRVLVAGFGLARALRCAAVPQGGTLAVGGNPADSDSVGPLRCRALGLDYVVAGHNRNGFGNATTRSISR